MHLTMIKMFLNLIDMRQCLGITIISLSYALRFLITIVRARINRAISEFYLVQVFHGGDILMKISKKMKILEKNED